jgi:aminoacrylate hydrolase
LLPDERKSRVVRRAATAHRRGEIIVQAEGESSVPKKRIKDGSEIAYEEFGEGTPLLLVPGLGGTGSYWKPNIAAFSERYRVIVHDHRGTGLSTRSHMPYSVEQMTADLIGLMDELGIERAHLVGHSTGGAMGQVVALDYPERLLGLVLYATWTKADNYMTRVLQARKSLALSAGVEAYVRSSAVFLYPDWFVNENAAALEAADRVIAANFPPVDIAAGRIDGILAFDREAYLGAIRAPTFVLGLDDDILTPAYFSRRLAAAIPNAVTEIVDRGGHAFSMTRPAEFNRLVLDFVDRVESRRV